MIDAATLAAFQSAASIAADAFESAGEDIAGVEIIEVSPDHPQLIAGGRRRVAVALRNTEGGEFILIRTNPPEDLEPLIQHEAAHLIAWRRYGESIKEHGREFLKVCRAVVATRPAYFCKRN